MSAFNNILQHRASYSRKQTTGWVEMTSFGCFLSIDGHVPDVVPERGTTTTAWRTGTLYASAAVWLQPGDRVTMMTGEVGTFVVLDAPSRATTPRGLSHREYSVREVGTPS